ncbi:hypothetical protein NL676_013046 [Syzygium grande]|nr:hypothetical protein NL676_013046 [Syzygium grande]
MASGLICNITTVNNAKEVSMMYAVFNASLISRHVVYESGSLKHLIWHNEKQRWTEFSYYPKEQCDYYRKCGPNGICGTDNVDQFDCTCLPGFEPKSPSDWYLKDGTGGCKRRQGVSMCQSGEGFVKVKQLKLPDTSTAHVDMGLSLKECEQECLRDCDCTAYSSANESMGNMDVSNSWYRKRSTLVKKAMVTSILVSALVLLLLGSFMYCLLLKRKRGLVI